MRRSCTTRPKNTGNVKYLRKIGYYDEAKSHFPDQTWCNAMKTHERLLASFRFKNWRRKLFFCSALWIDCMRYECLWSVLSKVWHCDITKVGFPIMLIVYPDSWRLLISIVDAKCFICPDHTVSIHTYFILMSTSINQSIDNGNDVQLKWRVSEIWMDTRTREYGRHHAP